MKNSKHALAALFFVSLLLLVTACGRSNRNNDDAATHSNIIGDWQPYSPTSNIHPTQDFGSQTVTIARLIETDQHHVIFQDNEPDPAISDNYRRDRMIWDNARRVEREFNIVVVEDTSRPARYTQLLSTSMAAGSPFADVLHMSPSQTLTAVVEGWLYPLDTINLPRSDLLGLQTYTRFVAEAFDHSWAFNTNEPDTSAFTLGVNMDIIREIGAQNPVELYNSGQWTWDAMLEIMRAATRDTRGGDTINQWGIAGRPDQLLMNFVGANDGILVTSELTHGFYDPNSYEALQFLETIFHEELWRPDREPGGGLRGGIGRPGVYYRHEQVTRGNTAFITEPSRYAGRAIPFELAIVPLPVGPSNTSGSTWLGGFGEGLALPHNPNWNPADLLAVMEEYFSWPGHDLELLNESGISWGSIELEGENALRQLNAMNTRRFDIGVSIPDFAHVTPNSPTGEATYLEVLAISMSPNPLFDNFDSYVARDFWGIRLTLGLMRFLQ